MALLFMATEHFCAQCHLCLSHFNDICNEEGRIELSVPNREGGLDHFLHQQHERPSSFQSLVNLPWKSVKWLQVIDMWQQVKPDPCGWEVHTTFNPLNWSMPGPMSHTSLRSPTGGKQLLCSLFSLFSRIFFPPAWSLVYFLLWEKKKSG